MTKYFRGIGILTIISFIIGAIADFVLIISIDTNFATKFTLIVVFIILLLVGPSIGLLFLSHADSLEKQDAIMDYLHDLHFDKQNKVFDMSQKENVKVEKNEPIKKEVREELKTESSVDKIEINGDIITVDNSSYNIQFISSPSVDGSNLIFKFYNRTITISCENQNQANKLYSNIKSKINNNVD